MASEPVNHVRKTWWKAPKCWSCDYVNVQWLKFMGLQEIWRHFRLNSVDDVYDSGYDFESFMSLLCHMCQVSAQIIMLNLDIKQTHGSKHQQSWFSNLCIYLYPNINIHTCKQDIWYVITTYNIPFVFCHLIISTLLSSASCLYPTCSRVIIVHLDPI